MTEAEVRRIVTETVEQTLLRLGIDSTDPIELQADMKHLRDWRQSVNTVKKQSLMTAVGIVTTGILGLIWVAFWRH